MSGEGFPVKSFKFSGGELQLAVDGLIDGAKYEVTARLNSSDDVMELLLLDEILQRHKQLKPTLTIPYLPYGRQDRVMHNNEAFSLKVMAKLLNGLCFDKIITYDCHSPVTAALIEGIREITQCLAILNNKNLVAAMSQSVLIAPDAGAAKKIYELARELNAEFAIAQKWRNVRTGEITHTSLDSSIGDNRTAFMVDDICDGGRTFLELAKVLRTKGFTKIYLYVTHGIFSQGLDVFSGLIDGIYTTNTFRNQPEHPLLTTFNIIGD